MADVAIGSANISVVQLTETSTPVTGAATKWKWYAKSGGIYCKSPAGVEWFVGGAPFTNIDVDGGAIDGTPIGASSPAAGTFTTLTSTSEFINNGAAGTFRSSRFQSGGSNRWNITCNSTAESGANAGSDLEIRAFGDTATYINTHLAIVRSSGNITTSANLTVGGTLSKGGGAFKIDHPLDPENRNLIHSFVEGPRADLIYRGRVRLVRGVAVVNIDTASHMTPGTFEALTRHTEADIFLQNTSGWEAVRGELVGNTLTIRTQNERLGDNDTIAWMVIAERNDPFYRNCDMTDEQGRYIVEEDKPEPTAAELAQLDAVEVDDLPAPSVEIVAALIGKRGYPMHARLNNLALPQRELRPRPRDTKPVDRNELPAKGKG